MARTRKTPKPKLPAHERIDPKADPFNVYPLLKELVRDHRPDLTDARIALAWRFGWKRNKDGLLALGKCKKAGDLDKQFHDFDFVIILNNEAWKTLNDTQRRALMHHELEHAAISEDQNGNPKKDARDRQMYRVRKHDLEEFRSIVKEYGCYKTDIESFVRAAVDSPKPPGPNLFDAVPFDAEKAAPLIEKELRDAGHDVTVTGKNGDTFTIPEMMEDIQKSFAAEPSVNGNGKPHVNGKPKSKSSGSKNRIKAKAKSKAKK